MADETFLQSTDYIDSDAPEVRAFAAAATAGIDGERARAVALYHAVRDSVPYEPYLDYSDLRVYRASDALKAGHGFCVAKAALLAACARAIGIPARTGYADVRNHMTSARLRELTQGDIFYWHSYTEMRIDGRWVKSTPAFDRALCERARLAPLDFDGVHDSLFQAYDPQGRRHMEYVEQRGVFADVPAEAIRATFIARYPRLIESGMIKGDFKAEVTQ